MHRNTISPSEQEKFILAKIRMLPPDKIVEISNFVEFISQKNQDRQLSKAARNMAENTFIKVWDNAEDEVYDQL